MLIYIWLIGLSLVFFMLGLGFISAILISIAIILFLISFTFCWIAGA